MTRAVLFDIDGTLVDSNYLHVDAWTRAFEAHDHPVDAWRVHRLIGKDGDQLLDSLAPELNESTRSRVSDEHSERYLAEASRLRPFEGARELLQELASRRATIVLATSAPQQELDALLQVLDIDDQVHAVTNADDVEQAKPRPDIVRVALDRAGADPREACFVGDSVWDVEAAGRAGVPCIGVRSGGVSDAELRDAGAVDVYDDAAALLAALRRGDGVLAATIG